MTLWEYLKLAAWLSGAVGALFIATGQVAKESSLKSLGQRMVTFDLGKWSSSWPSEFASIFDAVFGEKHLAFRCFGASCLASLTALFVVLFAFLFSLGVSVTEYVGTWVGAPALWTALAITIIGNMIPDYLSLLETRLLLRKMESSSKFSGVAFWLIVDVILTAAIFVTFFSVMMFILHSRMGREASLEHLGMQFWWTVSKSFPVWILDWPPDVQRSVSFETRIQFVTTFVTSIWLWLFALATIFTKVLDRVAGPAWTKLRDGFLDVEHKPMLALAWVSSAMVLVVFLVLLPIVLGTS